MMAGRNYIKKLEIKFYMLKNYILKQECYLGRIACLGNFVLDRYFNAIPIQNRCLMLNQQKMRVDLFYNYLYKIFHTPDSYNIEKYFARSYIFPVIVKQKKLPWLAMKKKKIKAFFMDSFSELTDQIFINKNNQAFCAHYNDMIHNIEFEQEYFCQGLLPIDELDAAYRKFFNWFEDYFAIQHIHSYPPPPHTQTNRIIPVFFIHFSTKFDKREKFHVREKEIKKIMLKLESEKRWIHNIFLDEKYITREENDDFPYHYSDYTYNKYLVRLQEVMQSEF